MCRIRFTLKKQQQQQQKKQQLLFWAVYRLHYPSVSYFLQILHSLINWIADVCKVFMTQRIIIRVKIYTTCGVFSLSWRYCLSSNSLPPSTWWPFITLSATKLFQKEEQTCEIILDSVTYNVLTRTGHTGHHHCSLRGSIDFGSQPGFSLCGMWTELKRYLKHCVTVHWYKLGGFILA